MRSFQPVQIVALAYEKTGEGDARMAALADRLARAGLRLAGMVQVNITGKDGAACDMDLVDLAHGGGIRISQRRGREASGCRLDSGALEEAAGRLEAALGPDTDVLVVSKFGQREAEGRGFRGAIAKAIELGIPVVVGLKHEHRTAFDAFAGPLGTVVDQIDQAYGWALGAAKDRRQTA